MPTAIDVDMVDNTLSTLAVINKEQQLPRRQHKEHCLHNAHHANEGVHVPVHHPLTPVVALLSHPRTRGVSSSSTRWHCVTVPLFKSLLGELRGARGFDSQWWPKIHPRRKFVTLGLQLRRTNFPKYQFHMFRVCARATAATHEATHGHRRVVALMSQRERHAVAAGAVATRTRPYM